MSPKARATSRKSIDLIHSICASVWNCCTSIVATPRFSRLFSVYSRIWSGGKQSSSVEPRREGHLQALGWNLGGGGAASCPGGFSRARPGVCSSRGHCRRPRPCRRSCSQARRPARASFCDSVFIRAGPARQSPHAVADLTHRPAHPPKGTVDHWSFPLMVSGCVECSLPGKVGGDHDPVAARGSAGNEPCMNGRPFLEVPSRASSNWVCAT